MHEHALMSKLENLNKQRLVNQKDEVAFAAVDGLRTCYWYKELMGKCKEKIVAADFEAFVKAASMRTDFNEGLNSDDERKKANEVKEVFTSMIPATKMHSCYKKNKDWHFRVGSVCCPHTCFNCGEKYLRDYMHQGEWGLTTLDQRKYITKTCEKRA